MNFGNSGRFLFSDGTGAALLASLYRLQRCIANGTEVFVFSAGFPRRETTAVQSGSANGQEDSQAMYGVSSSTA